MNMFLTLCSSSYLSGPSCLDFRDTVFPTATSLQELEVFLLSAPAKKPLIFVYAGRSHGHLQQLVGGICAQICILRLRQSCHFPRHSVTRAVQCARCAGYIFVACPFHSSEQAGFMQEWLIREAKISQPDLMRRLDQVSPTVPGKAWRFADEMRDDSRMFTAAGLHPGCQDAAAETFERLAHFKDAPSGAVPLALMGQCLIGNSKPT